MILTAHQPVYLPWLGFFHKIALADIFISMDMVQYQTNDWNNRNKIKISNGTTWLSVPVKKKERFHKPFNKIEIDNSKKWQKKHWMSILQNYKKARYFKKYADYFEEIYKDEFIFLSELNHKMLSMLLRLLGINTKLKYMRNYSFQGAKSDLILDMCQQLNANLFIFGSHGKDYVDENSFQQKNIKVHFQKYTHPQYPQLHGNYEPNLSIIDLLFNCGESSLEVLMSNNIDRSGLEESCQI